MMNGPLEFSTARKILPLLNLLAKFKRVLACSCSSNFCAARKLAKQFFFISARARTGSSSALCVGSGFRGHLVEFGRSILELLGYYLMPNKRKNLKDMKSSCLSVCTIIAFKITKVDISCIITCDSGPYCSSLITCIRIYNANKKKS